MIHGYPAENVSCAQYRPNINETDVLKVWNYWEDCFQILIEMLFVVSDGVSSI